MLVNQLFGHVKWFVGDHGGPEISLSATDYIVIFFILSIGALVLYSLRNFKFLSYLDKYSKKAWSYLPLIVRIVMSATIVLNAINNIFIAPNFDPNTTMAKFGSIALIVVAIMLAAGLYTKLAGWLLIIVFILSSFTYSAFDILDHLEIVGIGSFLIIAGGGNLSLDKLWGSYNLETIKVKKAVRQLQIWAGLAVICLALSEKLFGTNMAEDFLSIHDWNFMSGIGVSNQLFIITAGSIELLVGISLVLGWATRLTTLALLVLMTITASLLGIQEIYGHLFAVSIVASAWIALPSKDIISKITSK